MAKKKKKKEIKPDIYTDSVTYTCPVRGEVTQIVQIKKYPYTPYTTVSEKETAEISLLLSMDELAEEEQTN